MGRLVAQKEQVSQIGLKKAWGNNMDKIISTHLQAALFKQPAIKIVFKAQHPGSSRCKGIQTASAKLPSFSSGTNIPVQHGPGA